MTPEEAIYVIKEYKPILGFEKYREALNVAISALEEIQQYREIGTVEELKNSTREEDALKFYYCESEDDYYIGKRVGNFYYARYGKTGFTWFMSRYLPWGEHVIAPNTLWKEHIYPSEPKEMPFFEWLQGFIKRYCGGTVEECRESVEKQKPQKPKDSLKIEPVIDENGAYVDADVTVYLLCPNCGEMVGIEDNCDRFCHECGQAIDNENLEGMEDENT